MSEHRPATRVSLHRLPEIQGKKSIKIEYFPAKFWREYCRLYTEQFAPRLPFRNDERNLYFQERYRIRVNGTWFRGDARYTMLTKDEVDELVHGLLYDGQA